MELFNFHLGRAFWNSRYLSIEAYVGLYYVDIEQEYDQFYNLFTSPAVNFEIALKSNFRALGPQFGLGLNCHFGCGFYLYGGITDSYVFGRYHFNEKQLARLAVPPY